MDYPYTKSVKSIPRLFDEIRKVGTPPKVTVTYLKSIGFTSSNDSYLVNLLKGIDFISSSGVPTDRWKGYRGHDPRQVMAAAVRQGYGSLFATYPDAPKRDDEAIANLIRQNTNYGADTVGRVVASFKALCALSDFSEEAEVAATSGSAEPPSPGPALAVSNGGQTTVTSAGQPVINLNIQLELPPQADEKFYDAFFEAMKKHLMA